METRRAHDRQRGFSLVEITVVLAITTTVLLVFMSMIEEATRVSLFVESHNDLAVLSQRPVNTIQKDILQSKMVFSEDTYGTAMRGAIPLGTFPLAANSLLPILDAAGTLSPDTGATRDVGNCFLVARQLSPVAISLAADGVNPAAYPATTFNADRYMFEFYYLSENSARSFKSSGHYVDLIRYRSKPYCDYYQLNNSVGFLSTSQQNSLASQLTNATNGLTVAWDPSATAIGSAFFTVNTSALTFTAIAAASVSISKLDQASMLPEMRGGRISGRMEYTVAYRVGTPAPGNPITGYDNAHPVPLYAQANSSLPADCGFEVKVVGPAGSRTALLRLVLLSNYNITKIDSQEGFVIASFLQ
jgi:prepilin-type N-terminal cleavage/methylation domain-containing protein